MDTVDKETRHRNMAAIKSKNTKPELVVRKFLFSRGFRYRLNHRKLPGHPDIVMRKYCTCIFVNGCFWHGHTPCPYYRLPKTNTEFWQKKIDNNRKRDLNDQKTLAKMGWHCITIWECELKPKVRMQTLTSLEYTLNSIFLADHSKKYPDWEQDSSISMAAEPDSESER